MLAHSLDTVVRFCDGFGVRCHRVHGVDPHTARRSANRASRRFSSTARIVFFTTAGDKLYFTARSRRV